jgi:two-component system, chemotaxis family, protein-glutamate methylesterase/glutaminase
VTAAVGVVVVGASLGGLSALRKLLAALPQGFRPPLVIAQHRRPDTDSRLQEILAGACDLPLVEPEDKEALCAGCVYLAPANYHVLVEREALWLSIDAPVCFARPSIDVLFESAAESFGSAALAVVLTGSSDDGAAGARAIKRAGGMVMVEDPRTAESPVMPKAAMAATPVDVVLPLAELVDRLVEVVRGRGGVEPTAVDGRVKTAGRHARSRRHRAT